MALRQRVLIWLLQPLLALAVVALAGLDYGSGGCFGQPANPSCNSGSDHYPGGGADATSISTTPGVLQRWHDMTVLAGAQRFEAKDLAFLRGWLPGNWVVGLQVPTAPGATQPGTVTEGRLWLWMARQGGTQITLDIPLVLREDLAALIEQVYPAEAGCRWQALVPANDTYITKIPAQATTFTSITGSLYYAVDFHGTSVCNGCTIDYTLGTPAAFPPDLRLAARLLPNGLRFQSVAGLTCTEPVPTVIAISPEGSQTVPPAAPAAWLSAWGGPAFVSVATPAISLQYTLGHSLPATQTFQLDPIQSEQGWSYQWRDLAGNPITQMAVSTTPLGEDGWATNVKIVGTAPTSCQIATDRIHISARSLTNPAIQATNTCVVQVLPNMAQCATADLGLTQAASSAAITAGQTVTVTLTARNYETTARSGVITATLSPAAAVAGLRLPAGCARVGDRVVCQASNLPAGGQRSFAIGVDVARLFAGTITSYAVLGPSQAVDLRGYDNYAGPLNVTVNALPGLSRLHLPSAMRLARLE